jgi:hypothetical protein
MSGLTGVPPEFKILAGLCREHYWKLGPALMTTGYDIFIKMLSRNNNWRFTPTVLLTRI